MNKCQDRKVEKLFYEQLAQWGYTGNATWQTIGDGAKQRWRDWYAKNNGKLEEK